MRTNASVISMWRVNVLDAREAPMSVAAVETLPDAPAPGRSAGGLFEDAEAA
jgi:hypothetical protein